MKKTEDTSIAYYLTKVSEVSVGERYVYALDVEDVRDYLGKDDLSGENTNTMFYNTTESISLPSWLRSASSNYNDQAIHTNDHGFHYDYCSEKWRVRPAFVINLSQVEFADAGNPTAAELGWS